MFDSKFIRTAIDRSAENGTDRRQFLRTAGFAGMGALGATALGAGSAAATGQVEPNDPATGPSDPAILNFALNLEYLEAEFYLRGVTGEGLPHELTTGKHPMGRVTGGRKVKFDTSVARGYAREIAEDELAHVKFLRAALGTAAVSRPAIDLDASFTAAAQAAGLVGPGQKFDAFANENNFLLAAYIFEDVGVTAYKGAAPLVQNKTFLEAAAGLLAVEAYHAANVRTVLAMRGLATPSVQISDARDSLDGPTDLDQGVVRRGRSNIVPTDRNGLAYSRTAGQVLNVVYLNPESVNKGGFFPRGVNGQIRRSDSPS